MGLQMTFSALQWAGGIEKRLLTKTVPVRKTRLRGKKQKGDLVVLKQKPVVGYSIIFSIMMKSVGRIRQQLHKQLIRRRHTVFPRKKTY